MMKIFPKDSLTLPELIWTPVCCVQTIWVGAGAPARAPVWWCETESPSSSTRPTAPALRLPGATRGWWGRTTTTGSSRCSVRCTGRTWWWAFAPRTWTSLDTVTTSPAWSGATNTAGATPSTATYSTGAPRSGHTVPTWPGRASCHCYRRPMPRAGGRMTSWGFITTPGGETFSSTGTGSPWQWPGKVSRPRRCSRWWAVQQPSLRSSSSPPSASPTTSSSNASKPSHWSFPSPTYSMCTFPLVSGTWDRLWRYRQSFVICISTGTLCVITTGSWSWIENVPATIRTTQWTRVRTRRAREPREIGGTSKVKQRRTLYSLRAAKTRKKGSVLSTFEKGSWTWWTETDSTYLKMSTTLSVRGKFFLPFPSLDNVLP